MNDHVTEVTLGGMTWEGERGPFAKAFVAAQKATEAVKKASTNPAFKSKYADLAGVVEAVVPALNDNGIAVLQSPAFDGECVALTTTLLHESGSSVSSTLRMRPTKLDPQGIGSAVTYARRYALLAMSGAAPEDDDGNAASGPNTRQQAPTHQPAPPPPQKTLSERADDYEARLGKAKSVTELNRVIDLGKDLMRELDRANPDRHAEILVLQAKLDDMLSKPVADKTMVAA